MKQVIFRLRCQVQNVVFTESECRLSFFLMFSQNKDLEGTYFILINKFTDISEELPIMITKYGVSKSKIFQNAWSIGSADAKDTEFFLSISSEASFLLSKEQLKGIYNYIAESQKKLTSTFTSFRDINLTFSITNNLICSKLSSKKFSFVDPCTLE